jgi:hypothetical protein
MERLTIPDVRVDEHTTRRTMIDGEAVREHAMDFYWRLKAYEDIGLTPEDCARATEIDDILLDEYYPIGRMRELIKADKDGRMVVLPFTSGRTLLCKENIDSPQLMKDVELAIRYCSSCGIVFHMGYNVFCDLVKHGRITAVSEETEKALEAMKK